MNLATSVVLAAAAVCAVANWLACGRNLRVLEVVSKPATTMLLVAAAITVHPLDGATRAWFVMALALSLVGDVVLLGAERWFVAGLGAFLVAHLAYVAGFVTRGLGKLATAWTAVAVLAVMLPVAVAILRGARRTEPAVVPAVTAYIAIISTMLVCAGGSGRALALAGAATFAGSDSLIAWNRFVRPLPWAAVAIMVTYHLGQAALLLSLTN